MINKSWLITSFKLTLVSILIQFVEISFIINHIFLEAICKGTKQYSTSLSLNLEK